MPVFQKRDWVFGIILGELVGLFAYAIARELALPYLGVFLPLFVLGVPPAAVAALYATYLLGKRVKPGFFQFGKFATVGFSNTAIDWGIFNLILTPFGFATGTFALGKAVSFAIATLNSFFWNRFWSFEQRGTQRIGRQAVQFYLVTVGGLVINVGVATLVKVIGPDIDIWLRIVAPAAATVASLFWNFFGYKFIVFRPPATPSGVSETGTPGNA